jgi:para-nitrobenzyl esterase
VKPAQFVQQVRTGYGAKADSLLAVYPHSTDAEAFRATKNLFRDSVFGWPTWAWASLQSQKAKNNAYVYYFDHRPTPTADGADHGAEMAFVFRNLSAPGAPPPAPEVRALSEMMSQFWVNFAKTGNPNGPGLPAWPVFAASAPKVMTFDQSPSARDGVPNVKQLQAYEDYFAWRRSQLKSTGTN